MNFLRLACLILSLTTVFPPEALAQGSMTSTRTSAESRSGHAFKRGKLDRALQDSARLPARTRVIIRHRSDKADTVQQDVARRGGRFLGKHRRGSVAELSPKAL